MTRKENLKADRFSCNFYLHYFRRLEIEPYSRRNVFASIFPNSQIIKRYQNLEIKQSCEKLKMLQDAILQRPVRSLRDKYTTGNERLGTNRVVVGAGKDNLCSKY